MDVPRKPIPFLTPSEGRNVGVAFVVGAILTALAPLPLPLKVPALLVTCLSHRVGDVCLEPGYR